MADVRSALAGTGVRVGGSGVPELDLVRGAYRTLPGALAAMALLGFLALARPRTAGTLAPAGRAVLSALVAAVAVTGLLVLVWQYGFGSRLLGGEGATGAVTGWVPLVAGAFAFLNALDQVAYDALSALDRAVAHDALNALDRIVAYDAVPPARYRVGPVVALPLLAIGLGPQVELALLVTGVGGAALLGSVLLRAVAALSEPSRRVVHETATQPPASALPATPLSSYWSRPGLRLGHTIPLVEPPDHAQ